jgi:orotidine-5'-phosphate decarboxylase
MYIKPSDVKDRLVVALDVPERSEALELVEQLRGRVGMFKIGSQLFTAEGPELVREIVDSGERVFLDLKFHDIPNTVAGAAESAVMLNVSIFNVHTLGGTEMMQAAVRAVSKAAEPDYRPRILGVTVLTSMNDESLREIGIADAASLQVTKLALMAHNTGLDGVVASPLEIKLLRTHIPDKDFIILTPGIRPEWSLKGDQKRVATPASAINDGADYIVIGRPIIADPNPRTAAERVLEEMDQLTSSTR